VIGRKRGAGDTDIGVHRQAKRPKEEISLDSPLLESLNQTRSWVPTKEEDVRLSQLHFL
jgi:hypothetical protein